MSPWPYFRALNFGSLLFLSFLIHPSNPAKVPPALKCVQCAFGTDLDCDPWPKPMRCAPNFNATCGAVGHRSYTVPHCLQKFEQYRAPVCEVDLDRVNKYLVIPCVCDLKNPEGECPPLTPVPYLECFHCHDCRTSLEMKTAGKIERCAVGELCGVIKANTPSPEYGCVPDTIRDFCGAHINEESAPTCTYHGKPPVHVE